MHRFLMNLTFLWYSCSSYIWYCCIGCWVISRSFFFFFFRKSTSSHPANILTDAYFDTLCYTRTIKKRIKTVAMVTWLKYTKWRYLAQIDVELCPLLSVNCHGLGNIVEWFCHCLLHGLEFTIFIVLDWMLHKAKES